MVCDDSCESICVLFMDLIEASLLNVANAFWHNEQLLTVGALSLLTSRSLNVIVMLRHEDLPYNMAWSHVPCQDLIARVRFSEVSAGSSS